MNRDLLEFLSGSVPLGIALLLFLLLAFALSWTIIWRGTRFWTLGRFWKVMAVGLSACILIYMGLWRIDTPPPMPTRVLVYSDPPGDNDWAPALFASALKSRLLASRRHIIVLDRDNTPLLNRLEFNPADLESVALRLQVKWLVEFLGGGKYSLKRRSGSKYKEVAGEALGDADAKSAVRHVGEIAGRMGEKESLSQWGGMPAPVSDAQYERLYQALILGSNGEIDAAAALLTELADTDSAWAAPRKEYARLRLDDAPGLYIDEVHRRIMEALALDDRDPEALVILGRYFIYMRDWLEAESALKMALQRAPSYPQTLYYLSRLSDERHSDLPWRGERELLGMALHWAPGYEAARLALAEFHRNMLERRPALAVLNEGLVLDSLSTNLLLSLSATHLALGNNQAAADLCRRVLELKPANPAALYNLGISEIWLGNYDYAITLLDSSYRLGGSIENLYYIGYAYVQKNEWKPALRYFQMRMAQPVTREDRIAISARDMIRKLKIWITEEKAAQAKGDTLQ